MLKMIAIGNLTGDPVLKTNEETGKPYAIMRIASDRRDPPLQVSGRRETDRFYLDQGARRARRTLCGVCQKGLQDCGQR